MTTSVEVGLDLEVGGHSFRVAAPIGSGKFTADLELDLPLSGFIDGIEAGAGDVLPRDLLDGARLIRLAACYAPQSHAFAIGGECVAGGDSQFDFLMVGAPSSSERSGSVQPSAQKVLLMGVSLRQAVELKYTPLFGNLLQDIRLEQLQFVYASDDLDLASLAAGGFAIPQPCPGPGGETKAAVALPLHKYSRGLNIVVTLRAGDTVQDIMVQVPFPPPKPAMALTEEPAAATAPAAPGFTKWLNIGKTFGPLRIERVGVAWQNGELGLMLDAALSIAALSIGLQGFAVRFQPGKLLDPAVTVLNKFRISVDGLNIAWQCGSLSIAGAFLHQPGTSGDETVYSGAALLKMPSMTLAAIGSFAMFNDQPSVFIFLAMDRPLGGPPVFFVTGLAAGFGYNRDLVLPPAERVPDFSLVKIAIAPGALAKPGSNLSAAMSDVLDVLGKDVPIKPGANWVAAGVKFDSFQLLHSLALLVVRFGSDFELALIGRTALQLPTPEKAFISAELGLLASFKPSDGTLSVTGQLTPNSYLLDRNARPTGGFAFKTWFGKNTHAGDFALTLGGYHRAFATPEWYPSVPRVGFNWQVSGELRIWGEAYFALTPHAIMAGLRLEAAYQSGALAAWFRVSADFLVAWQPFLYDAQIAASIGASYSVGWGWFSRTFSVELGADVHLVGPPMHGEVRVNWWVISFTMTFGETSLPQGHVIGWQDFRAYFLPPDEKDVVKPRVTSGLITQGQDAEGTRWVIDPDHFTLSTDSLIPATKLIPSTDGSGSAPDVGIRPMNLRDLTSEHRVTISNVNTGEKLNLDDWKFERQEANVPAALWSSDAGSLELNVSPEQRVLPGCWVGLANGRPPSPPLGNPVPVELAMADADMRVFRIPLRAGLPVTPATAQSLSAPQARREDQTSGASAAAAPRRRLQLVGAVPPMAPAAQAAQAEKPAQPLGALSLFQAAELPALGGLSLTAQTGDGVWYEPGATNGSVNESGLSGIVQPGSYEMRLRPGLAVVWGLPLRAWRLQRSGGLDLRVTCFDRFDRVLEDQVLPAAGVTAHDLPAGTVRLCVQALAGVRSPATGTLLVSGWIGGSRLLQVSPNALLGEGVVVAGVAPHRIRHGQQQLDLGLVSAAELAATNLVVENAGGSQHGWIATRVPAGTKSVLVLLHNIAGTTGVSQDEARGAVTVMAGAYQSVAGEAWVPKLVEAVWSAVDGDRLILGCRLPAVVADEQPAPWQVLVTPKPGWIQAGVLALPEPLPAAFTELKTLRLPASGAAQPNLTALETVTLASLAPQVSSQER